jgi:hypothetical protein
MKTNNTADTRECFEVPSRTLRGSKQEMLQSIDQAIVGLLALRHLIDSGNSPYPAVASHRGGASALDRAWEWIRRQSGKLSNGRDEHGTQGAS